MLNIQHTNNIKIIESNRLKYQSNNTQSVTKSINDKNNIKTILLYNGNIAKYNGLSKLWTIYNNNNTKIVSTRVLIYQEGLYGYKDKQKWILSTNNQNQEVKTIKLYGIDGSYSYLDKNDIWYLYQNNLNIESIKGDVIFILYKGLSLYKYIDKKKKLHILKNNGEILNIAKYIKVFKNGDYIYTNDEVLFTLNTNDGNIVKDISLEAFRKIMQDKITNNEY